MPEIDLSGLLRTYLQGRRQQEEEQTLRDLLQQLGMQTGPTQPAPGGLRGIFSTLGAGLGGPSPASEMQRAIAELTLRQAMQAQAEERRRAGRVEEFKQKETFRAEQPLGRSQQELEQLRGERQRGTLRQQFEQQKALKAIPQARTLTPREEAFGELSPEEKRAALTRQPAQLDPTTSINRINTAATRLQSAAASGKVPTEQLTALVESLNQQIRAHNQRFPNATIPEFETATVGKRGFAGLLGGTTTFLRQGGATTPSTKKPSQMSDDELRRALGIQ